MSPAAPHYRCFQAKPAGSTFTQRVWLEVAKVITLENGRLSLLIVLALVALGVLGRADLASLGVDACTTLSFDLDYFAGGFWWHVCIYLT